MMTKIYIQGMSCEHCAKRVKESLLQIPTVSEATVNLEQRIAVIQGKATNQEIFDAIDGAGYEVIRIDIAEDLH